MAKISDTDVERLRAVVGLGQQQQQPARASAGEVELKDASRRAYIPDETKDNQLFVKIEEHDQIADSLTEAKKDIKAIADTIELLARAEKLKADAIERMEHHIDSFESMLHGIESRIVPPEDVLRQNATIIDVQQTSKLNTDLKSLKATLEQLK